MITFAELGRHGRLGNQLFQYAALRALSLERGYEVKIPDPKAMHWHGQECLLDQFSIDVPYLEIGDVSKIRYVYNEPDHMSYDTNFYKLPDATNITGFFQSTKYFAKYEKRIRKELTPKSEHLLRAEEKIQEYKSSNPGKKIVSLHLRRGDNTNSTNPNDQLNNMYGSDSVSFEDSFYGKYLTNALSEFKSDNCIFLVFSGGSREEGNDNSSDLEWCKDNLPGEEFLISKPATTMEDFSLIMSCDHNIISPVSSFGWWAAFMNIHKDKIIVAPNHYHPDMPNYTHRDGFYPKDWKIV